MKFYLLILSIILLFFYTNGARPAKPITGVNVNAIQETNGRPQYINQFSLSVKFLTTFLKVIQSQITNTVNTWNPSRPNPILSALLANPSLIPIALKRIKEPIAEMVTIMEKIDTILTSTDSSTQLATNTELQKLLQQLHRRLQSMFGTLIPNSAVSLVRKPMPTDVPALMTDINSFVEQFSATFTVFSQSVGKSVSAVGDNQRNGVNTLNKTEMSAGVEQLCDRLHSLLNLVDMIEMNGDVGNRQILSGLTELITSLITAIPDLLASLFNILLGSITFSNGGPATTEIYQSIADTTTTTDRIAVIPFTNWTKNGVEYQGFGFMVDGKLMVTNVMNADNSRYHLSKSVDSVEILTLKSLQSMMSSLVIHVKDSSISQSFRTIRCQVDALGCSLASNQNYTQVQLCLQIQNNCAASAFY